MHKEALSPTLKNQDFTDRFTQLHRQLWRTPEYGFDDVTVHVFSPPKGMYLADHSFIKHDRQLHLHYVTGDLTTVEQWHAFRQLGDLAGASAVSVESGNGHAVGSSIWDLSFVEHVFFPSQGAFDRISRSTGHVFCCGDRFGMLYMVRGEHGDKMSLAWSSELNNWQQDDLNPVLSIPAWANPKATFKDPHVMQHHGIYLIYAVTWNREGQPAVCLFTTEDWRTFQDQGVVFATCPQLRGTFGIESPQVVFRNGMWHLFYTQGPGLWHAVAPSPTAFLARGQDVSTARPMPGAYLMGPYHATEVVHDGDDWWLTTDRKEYQRRLNRLQRRPLYRGEYEDDQPMEEGLYLARLNWDGDQPILSKPVRPTYHQIAALNRKLPCESEICL